MRAIVTRVTEASVTIDGAEYGRIGRGFLVLLGVHVSDTAAEADRIVDRICGLRVFEDAQPGKMDNQPHNAGPEAAHRESVHPLCRLPLPPPRLHGRRPAGDRRAALRARDRGL